MRFVREAFWQADQLNGPAEQERETLQQTPLWSSRCTGVDPDEVPAHAGAMIRDGIKTLEPIS